MKHFTTGSKLFLLLFIMLLAACGDEEVEIQQEFSIAVEDFDISYGNNELQTYDLFLPAGRSSATTDLVLLIHGGSWISGDKSDIAVSYTHLTLPTKA